MTLEEVKAYHADPKVGLTSEQVDDRVKNRLTNKKKKQTTKSYGKILFDNICNPFNLLLVCITGVMIWGKSSITHFLFAFVLAANIIIGIYQDIHARHLTEKLQLLSEDKCLVVRNGEQIRISPEGIVLGDIVILHQGDQIPADGIIRIGEAALDESLLTGESDLIRKAVGEEVLSGSFLKAGTITIEITAVGKEAYAEKIRLAASQFKRPKSEIAQSVWNITVTCTLVALIFAAAYIGVSFWKNDDLAECLVEMNEHGTEFIDRLSGLMVALLPTGMFLLTSIALTAGVITLSKKGILVQELYSLETLARADVVCFDKTGTLTDGNMSVYEEIPLKASMEEVQKYIRIVLQGTKDENATALALKAKYGLDEGAEITAAIPFDSQRKCSAASIKGATYVIGAYGYFDHDKDEKIESLIEEKSKSGYRCLVIGKSEKEILNKDLQGKFSICAVITLLDHIKPSAKENIAWFQSNDVDLRIISGDNPITVAEIARQCGVIGADKCVDMTGVKQEDIPALIQENKIFGRVSPEQKEWIVLALQSQGHKVAMTGDGVNDVLALKQADCAIAMASGATSAKNVSHLVCTNSDFSSLPNVVAEGRRVINNLQRSCTLFLAKTVFALLVSVGFLISMSCGGIAYPFETSHMIVWEIFSIGLPSFFLALQPNNERIEGSMMANIISRAVPSGVAEASCVGLAYLIFVVIPQSIAYNPEEYEIVVKALAIVAFSVFSYVTLWIICRPFNKYRAFVFGGSLAAGIIIFTIDFFVRVAPGFGVILHFMWGGFATTFVPMLLAVLAVAIGVYIGVYYICKRIKIKKINLAKQPNVDLNDK